MPQKPRSSGFESSSARLRLAIHRKPYTAAKLRRGLLLLYRRNDGPGVWIVRVCRDGEDWTKRIGVADDRDPANGRDVLSYFEAIDEAKRIADAGKPTADSTVKGALDRYKTDLEERSGDPNNVKRVLKHLPTKLAGKHVPTLTDDDLEPFRKVLLANMKRNSARRTLKAFKAALNFVSPADITRRPWSALKIEDGSDPAHNVILDDHDRRAVRAAAHRDSEQFGLLIEILDETGARPSQAARLMAGDVQADFVDPRTRTRTPRLMMPVSRKGKGQKSVTHQPVPISEALAGKLAKLVKAKKRDDALLHRADGVSWSEVNLPWHFDSTVTGVKFNNASKVTMYALRHTSIVRQLLAGVPIAVVARLHDTSTVMIEKHYSEHIASISDALARATLPAAPEVVSLDDRRVKG